MDKLIVNGLDRLDGEYEFTLSELISEGHPDSLTIDEDYYIRVKSGVRRGELLDQIIAADTPTLTCLSAIILRRHRKQFEDDLLWKNPWGGKISWELAVLAEDDASPPAEPAETSETERSSSGGESSKQTSGHQENGHSPTGHPVSLRSVTSDPVTSGS